jgi:large subunit ribosomal protein L10
MKRIGQIYRETLASHVKEGSQDRKNTFLLSFTKLSASEMNNFRKDLKKIGAEVFVARNSVAELALQELKRDSLATKIGGQTLFVWSDTDSAEVSKTLVKFCDQFDGMIIHGGVLEGALVEKNDIKRLSDLPSRQVLLSQLLQVIQSPITRLMGAFNGKTRDLIYVLKQLSEKKGGK